MKRLRIGVMALLLCFCMAGCRQEMRRDMLTETVPETLPETKPAATEQTVAVPETTMPVMETQPTEPSVLPTLPEPADDVFVRVADYIPDIAVDLKYATEDNFTGQVIYDFQNAYLRYGTVKKLMAVQEELRQQKLSLKIWDGFRPTAAQFRLWEVCPDARYVANPNNGFSAHSRGNTLDVTLVDENGLEIEMPTGFDDFSPLADRDYSDCGFDARLNALLLEQTMTRHGFTGYAGEWWHFTDTVTYPVDKEFMPE